MRSLTASLLISIALATTACGSDSPTNPSQDEAAVFLVNGETFRIRLSTPELRDAARAVRGGARARIPLGRILPGADINTGWSWHLTDVSFHEVTIELCDGRPSDVAPASWIDAMFG